MGASKMTDAELKKTFYDYAELQGVYWLLGWLKSAHLCDPSVERSTMISYLKEKGVL